MFLRNSSLRRDCRLSTTLVCFSIPRQEKQPVRILFGTRGSFEFSLHTVEGGDEGGFQLGFDLGLGAVQRARHVR